MIKAEVVAKSVSPDGVEITTLQLVYPRYIHSEFMTHRVFSRNAQSSRAIPIQKLIDDVLNNPVEPVFMKNCKGMAAMETLTGEDLQYAKELWVMGATSAILTAKSLMSVGVHKQIANRVLEPYSHIRTIVTATDWNNFFSLRLNESDGGEKGEVAVMQEMSLLAKEIRDAIEQYKADYLNWGEWHLPYVNGSELTLPKEVQKAISTARCARVSYMKHDSSRPVVEEDVKRHDSLLAERHMSPFEHIAYPVGGTLRIANLKGWGSYRWDLEQNLKI